GRSQERLVRDQPTTLGDVAALVARNLLEAPLDRFMPPLDVRIVGRLPGTTEQQCDLKVVKKSIEVLANEDRPVVAMDRIGHYRGDRVRSLQRREVRHE